MHAHTHTHTHTHTDIVDKIHCTGLIAPRLNYVRSPRPDLRLTLPLMAWPGSQGPSQLPQVSAVPYIRPLGLITPLGFCDQPLSPHTGAPGVLASSPNPPCIHSCGCRQSQGASTVPGNHVCPENGSSQDSSVTLLSPWDAVICLSF